MKYLLVSLTLALGLVAAFPQGGTGTTPTVRYQTVAEMVAATVQNVASNSRLSALVTGRSAQGDQGGDLFFFIPGSAAATNTSTIFPSTGVAGRWIRQYGTIYDSAWENGAAGNIGVGTGVVTLTNTLQVAGKVAASDELQGLRLRLDYAAGDITLSRRSGGNGATFGNLSGDLTLSVFRNQVTGAGTSVGSLEFEGLDNLGNSVDYWRIYADQTSNVDGAENTTSYIKMQRAGAETRAYQLDPTAFQFFNTIGNNVANIESLRFDWTGNIARIFTDSSGTGTSRTLRIGVGGTQWNWTIANVFGPITDNTEDFGTTSAKIRNGYFGTRVVLGNSTSEYGYLYARDGSGFNVALDASLDLAWRQGTVSVASLVATQPSGTVGAETGQFRMRLMNGGTTAVKYDYGTNFFRFYNTVGENNSNWEAAGIDWNANRARITSSQVGSGTLRALQIGTDSSALWQFDVADNTFHPATDGSANVGTTSLRPDKEYLKTRQIIGNATSESGFIHIRDGSGDQFNIDDNLNVVINRAGSGIRIKEGSNARMGATALVNGTVTVNNTSVTASTRIFLTRGVRAGTTVGVLGVGTVVAATSFVIESVDLAGALSADDDSTVNWLLVEPSP